jgi:dipeptidyl aminopeptidase/acylaminoacyl peptidase
MLSGERMWIRAAAVMAVVLIGLLAAPGAGAQAGAASLAPSSTTSILAPVGHQAGWLDLLAPRPRFLTHVDAPDYVSDVAVSPDARHAAIVVARLPAGVSVPYGELMMLDLTTSTLAPLAGGQDPAESLGAPVWSADGSRVLFQREDVSGVGTSFAGGATVQYPSRIEQVNADGSARMVVAADGRQPAGSQDPDKVAFVSRSERGASLVVHSVADGSDRTIIAAGQFGDIASPRYAPQGDRIAFMAPVGLAPQAGSPRSGGWFAAPVRLAHGTPWDVWVVSADGSSGAVRLAALGADDGTLSWSPDGSRVFVYGGTGSYIVDAASSDVLTLSFVSGYGATSWVSD